MTDGACFKRHFDGAASGRSEVDLFNCKGLAELSANCGADFLHEVVLWSFRSKLPFGRGLSRQKPTGHDANGALSLCRSRFRRCHKDGGADDHQGHRDEEGSTGEVDAGLGARENRKNLGHYEGRDDGGERGCR